jgi:hypothetical protein
MLVFEVHRERNGSYDVFKALVCLSVILSGCSSSKDSPDPTGPSIPVIPASSIAVSLPADDVLPGQSLQATAIVRDAQGNSISGKVLSWVSSNPSIATVSSTGLVTGIVGGGPVTITASVDGVSGSHSLQVTPSSVTITAGGTYSGIWASSNPNVPAITVTTTSPVIIENCVIRSKGTLVRATAGGANVTIRNCSGYGLDPEVSGMVRGDFFFGFKIGSLTAENNYMEGVNFGFRIYQAGTTPTGPISIRFNRAKNLDGVPSDGKGGRILTGLQFDQDNGNHFFIIANSNNIPRLEIAWNEITNEPFVSSVGDVMNIYSSSGSSASPIDIHDNMIWGGYPADLAVQDRYFGGGITMDGSAMDTPSSATSFVRIHDNQLVAGSNFGVGLATGHDNEAYRNRAISTGQLRDGRRYRTSYGTGLYVWNCTCYNQPPSVFFNNSAHDNVAGWAPVAGAVRLDFYLPGCEPAKCSNNVSVPDPISFALEDQELVSWNQKLVNNAITVGPVRIMASSRRLLPIHE